MTIQDESVLLPPGTPPVVAEDVPTEPAPPGRGRRTGRVRRALTVVGALVVLAALWEGYKALEQGIEAIPLPVRGDDRSMPHVRTILGALGEDTRDGFFGIVLLRAAWFTLKEALAGFATGTVFGVALALLFLRASVLERGLMPFAVASQTVPLVALAPMVVVWGGRADLPVWMSVAIISAYLTFFPVVVNTLRGLKAPAATSLELMRSYAATDTQTLLRLRVPAALPFLFTALKVAATASVVGAIVGELPAGLDDGLGRALLSASYFFGTGPERLFATVLVSALVGLVFVGAVVILERVAVPPLPTSEKGQP